MWYYINMMKNKSTIAKLLAEEDIYVVYRQIETAYFNSKTRELGLPIWKDEEMTPDMHDLMVIHETAHALWTPLDMLERAAIRKINHSFVNIVEDARIERKAQDKYPGSVAVFKRGYRDLSARDFFGLNGKDVSKLNLIDRINLFFKKQNVEFSDEEKIWVKRVAETKTSDDVLDLAEELYKYMEENESETDNHDNGENELMGDPGPAGESGEDETGESGDGNDADDDNAEDGNGSSSDKGEEIDEDSNDNSSAGNNGVGSDNCDDDSLDDGVEKSTPEGGENSSGKGSAPVATTDTASKEGLDALRDKTAADRIYANIPKLDLNKVIVSYSDLLKEFGDHYSERSAKDGALYGTECAKEIATLKTDSKKIVSYMVKEFEMKKAADQYARAAVSKTGSLDMNRIHTYKYNEDLFKKVTTLPGATNHGMVMVLDWSGSMNENLKGTLSQLFNLIWFCRQTQIPFEVFAFSDHYGRACRNDDQRRSSSQTYKAGDLEIKDFKLLNFFSSNMSIKEEIEMMNILFMYINRYNGYRDWNALGYPYSCPDNIQLGGTPLNDAIIAMMSILPKFKSDTGVQKVNTIFLTDGASNSLAGVMDYRLVTDKRDDSGAEVGTHVETIKLLSQWRMKRDKKIIFTDPVTNKTVEVEGYEFTETLLKMLKNRVYDMNVIGFFIAGSGRSGRVDKRTLAYTCGVDTYGAELRDLVKKINKDKYLAVTSAGYDEYYILPGGNSLMVENSGLSDDLVGASKAKLKSAFGKSMKGKIESRQLLNKFVKLVA